MDSYNNNHSGSPVFFVFNDGCAMVVITQQEQSPPSFLFFKLLFSITSSLVLLVTLVNWEYDLSACLSAIRLYSCSIVVVETSVRLVQFLWQQSDQQHIPTRTKSRTSKTLGIKVRDILTALVESIGCIVCTHILIVLFGAPVFESLEETFTLSLLLTSLALVRHIVTIGPRIFSISLERKSWEEEEIRTAGVALGAWVGAFPIPLDWDRPWQVWPLTCCFGAVLAELSLSSVFAFKLWQYKKSTKTKHN